jgi:hypothetical protein
VDFATPITVAVLSPGEAGAVAQVGPAVLERGAAQPDWW